MLTSKFHRVRRRARRHCRPNHRAVKGFQRLETRNLLAQYDWVGGAVNNNWANTANWNVGGQFPDAPPGPADDAVFGAVFQGTQDAALLGLPSSTKTYQVSTMSVVGPTNVTLDLQGHILSTTGLNGIVINGPGPGPTATFTDTSQPVGVGAIGTDQFLVGPTGVGTAKINNTTLLTNSLTLGSTQNGWGNMSVSNAAVGADEGWIANGQLAVQNGSLVSTDPNFQVGSALSPPNAPITSVLSAGWNSQIRMNGLGIANAVNPDPMNLPSGQVILNGPNASLDTSSNIEIGAAGSGTLEVNPNTVARTNGAYVGIDPPATGLATVQGGIWSVRQMNPATSGYFAILDANGTEVSPPGVTYSRMLVGLDAPGTVNISAGGQVEAGDTILGAGNGPGTITIDSTSKLIVLGGLYVGDFSTGTVTNDRGLMFTQFESEIANGLVKLINGAQWFSGSPDARTDIDVGDIAGGDTGRLQIDTSTVYADDVIVYPTGILSGDGTVVGKVINAGGKILPGKNGGLNVIGTLNVNGTFDATGGGTLVAEIAGPSDNDRLAISGTAALGGQLVAPAIGSPDFEPGQEYTVLTSGGLSGDFSNLVPTETSGGIRYLDVEGGGSLPSLPSGLFWEVEYSSTAVTLVVIPAVSVESNGDINESDTSPGSFEVTRTGPVTDSLTVSYSTSGSAVSGTDYKSLSGSVTIPAGSHDARVDVKPLDDGDSDDTQSSETLGLTLKPELGSYAVGTPASADMTISEESPPTVTITADVPDAVEDGTDGEFTVSRTGPTDSNLTVNLQPGGTAVPGHNYTALPSSVTIPAGSRTAVLQVAALEDSPGSNDPEDVNLAVRPGQYTIGSPGAADVYIEEQPVNTVTLTADADTAEGSSTPGEFTVTRDAPYTNALSVSYELGGPAINGTDYQMLPTGTVTIAAGSPSAVIDIVPLDDGSGDDDQPYQTVLGTLVTSANYLLGSAYQASLNIYEEPLPPVEVVATTPTVGEEGTTPGVLTFINMGDESQAITVNYTFSGTAVAGTDFTNPGTSVTLPAGVGMATVNLYPLDDGAGDDGQTSEAATLTISPSSDYALGPLPSATVTFVKETAPRVRIEILKEAACNCDGGGVDCAAEDGRSAFRDGRFLPELPFSSATNSRGGAV